MVANQVPRTTRKKLEMSGHMVSLSKLRKHGIEILDRGSSSIKLPTNTRLEAPSSLKWTEYHHSIHLGAFSYQVSGYCFAARIGRYCSFGEEVQIGRQNHPLTWASTSPVFYLGDKVFDLNEGFEGARQYHDFAFQHSEPPTKVKAHPAETDYRPTHAYRLRCPPYPPGCVEACWAKVATWGVQKAVMTDVATSVTEPGNLSR